MRNPTLERKIAIFKTIAISKIVFESFIATVPRHIINELEKIQKAFLWKNFTPKIKHQTLCNGYKAGGLKNVDIPNKIIALPCSWIRTFFDYSFHEWRLIPLYLIEKSFGRSFKFHSNLLFKSNKARFFPCFYREFFLLEKTSYYDESNTFLYSVSVSVVQCQYPDRKNLYSFFMVFRKKFCFTTF